MIRFVCCQCILRVSLEYKLKIFLNYILENINLLKIKYIKKLLLILEFNKIK